MGFFSSFEEKVDEAIREVVAKVPGVNALSADVDGKVVTLIGEVIDVETKGRVSATFNELIETDNTFNKMAVLNKPVAATAASAMGASPADTVATTAEEVSAADETIHEVVSGDTLGGIAQKYYGKASKYMVIFNANTDILDNPNLIKVGQKLRIPSLED